MLILCIRAADQCTIEHMLLLVGVLTLCQTRSCTVVREFRCGFIVANFIGTVHGVIPQQIFHLSLCPFAVFAGLSVVVIFIVYQRHHLSRRIVSCRAPCVQPEITSRCNGSHAASHVFVQGFCYGTPAVHFLVGALSGSFLVFVNEVRVLLAGDLAQNTLHAAPDIVPAVDIAGCCIVVVVREDLFQIVVIAGDLVHPCRSPAVIVFPLGRIVISLRTIAVVAQLLFVSFCEFIQCCCIVQRLLCIFRIGVLEVQVVDRQRSSGRSNIVCLWLIAGEEKCRTIHFIQFRCVPVSVVNVTVAYLIAMCNHVTVGIQEGTLHQIVVKVPQNSFDMVVLTSFLVSITEFVIAPAQCCCGVVLRHTEFYMVAGIMETAGNIDVAVPVRIQYIFILGEEIGT